MPVRQCRLTVRMQAGSLSARTVRGEGRFTVASDGSRVTPIPACTIATSEATANAMDAIYEPAAGATDLLENASAAWVPNVNDAGPWGLSGGGSDRANRGAR